MLLCEVASQSERLTTQAHPDTYEGIIAEKLFRVKVGKGKSAEK